MRDRCSICGALLSENNTTGIGVECAAAVFKAQSSIFFSNEEYKFRFNYLIEAEMVRERFVSLFEGTKFRSEFNRSFYESMRAAKRISKKQLEIMKSKIQGKDADIYGKLCIEVSEERKCYLRSTCDDITVTRAQVEIARKSLKK